MNCAGCGAPVPPNEGRGRTRKWCTDTCRKRTLYSRECQDCGAICNTDGRVRDASVRCASCHVLFQKTDTAYITRQSELLRGRVTWTDEQILAAVRRSATDGIASADAYKALRAADPASAPTIPIIFRRFGSWVAAVERAGLKVKSRRTGGHYSNWIGTDVVIAAVRECAAEYGRRPTLAEYSAWARHHRRPCGTLVRARFGGWIAAMDQVLDGAAA